MLGLQFSDRASIYNTWKEAPGSICSITAKYESNWLKCSMMLPINLKTKIKIKFKMEPSIIPITDFSLSDKTIPGLGKIKRLILAENA